MRYVKDIEWLINNIDENYVRVIDCRFSLAEPEKGRKEYSNCHLPGAAYFDLEKDLSSIVQLHGGRHPLPAIEDFVDKLELAGIDENKIVIAYDNGEGAFAARFWWLLHYLGHEKIYVLDGGFQAWLNAGYPVTTDIPSHKRADFHFSLKPERMIDLQEVKRIVEGNSDSFILIDSREEKRYLGIEEPIDKKAGHIPGAINKPWTEGFSSGKYKVVDQQIQRFADVDVEKEIIVYCGSGVTAVPNYLALKEAGFKKVRLYVGSFSDWISYEDNKIN